MLTWTAASVRSVRRAGSTVSVTAVQERGSRGQPSAGLRPARRALQLRRDLLIRPGCGLGPMPGPAVRISSGIGDLRQRPVDLLPFLE